MSHTPGPWECAQAGIYADGKRVLVEYFVRVPESDIALASEIIDPDGEPSEDNARLMAAAPDLLEACEARKAQLKKIGLDRLNDAGLAEYATLYAAIAKARGEK